MSNTRSREIPVIEPDPELEITLRRMNQNSGIQGDEVDQQMPQMVDGHDPVLPHICGVGEIRRQPSTLRPQEYYRGYENIADFDEAELDTIVGACYGKCTYAETFENLEKVSQNNNAWSTRKSDTGRNNFVVQSVHNSVAEDLREEMAQMRTELRFVLKQLLGVRKM